MTQGRVYRNTEVTSDSVELDDLERLHGDTQATYWLDIVDPGAIEIEALGRVLGINAFHLEDALKGRQRPKIEFGDSYIFINAYSTEYHPETRVMVSDEIAIFVTHNGVITVRDADDFDREQVIGRWDSDPELISQGSAYLLWGLLDVLIDGYFVSLDALDEDVEELEDLLFSPKRNNDAIHHDSYALRKALVILRRHTLPMREVVGPLLRQNQVPISLDMSHHFQDLYDHVVRVADWTESLRDLISTLMETNVTIQGNQMNLIMKKVTSWAAIIAVPTAITGFYGQNVPYPGYMEPYGFWVSTGAIVVISAALYGIFKKNDWL